MLEIFGLLISGYVLLISDFCRLLSETGKERDLFVCFSLVGKFLEINPFENKSINAVIETNKNKYRIQKRHQKTYLIIYHNQMPLPRTSLKISIHFPNLHRCSGFIKILISVNFEKYKCDK